MATREAKIVDITQALGNLLETSGDVESEILARVWGSRSYDENHLDPLDLSSMIMFNVEWLLRSLADGTPDSADLPGMDEAFAVAHEIGERRAIQGVAIDAVIRSWRTAERVLEERLIGYAGDVETHELLDAIKKLSVLIATLTDHSVESYRHIQQEVTGHYDRLTTDLVAQIVSGSGLSASEIEQRARVIQADPNETYAAVAVGIPERDSPATHSHAQRHLLSHVGLRLQGRILIGSLEDRPLLLLPAADEDQSRLIALLQAAVDSYEELPSLLLGVSTSRAQLGQAHEAAQQARLALEVAQRLGRSREVVPYSSVAVETLLLREPTTAEILLDCIRPILDRPELIDTLRVYLSSGLSARAASRVLFVHSNTVPHRLRTITSLLGRNLDDVRENADITLALRWLELRR
jgi:sugar diacid utilization regulator